MLLFSGNHGEYELPLFCLLSIEPTWRWESSLELYFLTCWSYHHQSPHYRGYQSCPWTSSFVVPLGQMFPWVTLFFAFLAPWFSMLCCWYLLLLASYELDFLWPPTQHLFVFLAPHFTVHTTNHHQCFFVPLFFLLSNYVLHTGVRTFYVFWVCIY